VAYTPKQHRLINYLKDSYDECRDENKSLYKELALKAEALDMSREAEQEMQFLKEQAKEIDKKQTEQIELLEDTNKKMNRKLRMANIRMYIVGGAAITVGTYIGNKIYPFISF
jgi:hypothetical protein